MESDNHYAQRQVRQFKADSVAQIVATGLDQSKLLVSRVQRNTPEHGFATPTKPDAVFSILVQLRQQDRRELYVDNKLVHQGTFPKRTVSVVNHRQRPKANLLSAFDTVIFTVPQSALNAVAADQHLPPVEPLVCEHEGRVDEAIWSLTHSLLPALERPQEVGSLYAERVLLASTIYFAHTFGGMRPPKTAPHHLSPKEVRRVIELMDSEMQNDVSSSSLASELDITAGQLIRSFRRSSGKTPDVWLRDRRVERAKTLLRGKPILDAQIALLCGFASADQFVREFTTTVGVAPNTWRQRIIN